LPRENLTDKRLQALKAAPKGGRYDISDGIAPGLAVRVTDKGTKTFVLVARFPGSANPTRRAIGEYGAITLEGARETARKWLQLIQRGLDPKVEDQREREEAARKRANTFEAVVEDYLADIKTRKRNRHVEQDEREIRRELLQRVKSGKVVWRNKWVKKAIADISDADIAELIGEIRDRPAPGMAYNVWGHVKAIFSWAMWPERRQGYGLTVNPTAHLQPKHFKLTKTVGKRVLTDNEIRAYWAAAEATPYPLGSFYKMLMLTGQRKAEVSDAQWPEFAMGNQQLWTVPEDRFKSGQSHIVPISSDVLAVLDALPRFKGEKTGKYLFTTALGVKPINGFSRAKAALDAAMLIELKKADPDATLPAWTFHDVRRTVRTRLSGLRVNSDIAEMVIGHGKTGLRRVYDQYEFESEMREALEKWAGALNRIVNQDAATNVVSLPART
jgi:integrase